MFLIKLAGMLIGMDETYPYVRDVCRDYLVPDPDLPPLFTVRAMPEELACMTRSVTWKQLSPGEAESMVLMRKIALKLPEYSSFLLHASVVQCRNMTIAFPAARGVGKTTHALLWLDAFPGEARILNGDKPFLRVENHAVTAYGTPWGGKEGMQLNAGTALNAVCFLERGTVPEIRSLDHEEYVRRLVLQTYLPSSSEELDRCARLFSSLIRQVPGYVLKADISPDSVRKVYRTISEQLL